MQIITTREFRANQKKYFELAEKETIFVSRRNAAPIVVYAATEEDFPSREELEAIQRGIEDIKQGQNNTQGQNKKAKNSAQKQSAQSKNQCNEKSRQSHCSVCYKISYGKGSLRKIFRTERRTTAKLRTRHRSPLRCTLTSVHLHLCALPSFKLFFRIILSFFPIVKCFLCFFYISLTFMQKREKQLLSLSFFVKLHGFFSVSQRKG